jgi:type IV pilus assembly protein PilB
MSSLINYLPLEPELRQLITPEQAWHYRIIPKSGQADTWTFYTDGEEADLSAELEVVLGKRVCLEGVSTLLIDNTLNQYFLRQRTVDTSVKRVSGVSEDFLLTLIREAKELGSSDIHIEIYDERCRIRIRIDGMLVERYVPGKEEYPALINKIKISANLDIAEKRLPQDGRIFFQQERHKFDIRVSVLPTLHGEKVVMRILNNDAANIDIAKLGFAEADLKNYLEGIRRPNGMMLISGPTGSGKTTTLYATLKLLNQVSRNIVTIEDPIEYTLEGINQVQIKESIGLNFASALRTFLRQDPNVIMVGEIRDVDTANMAVRASLTGHLVLSTIHTNSAWGTVSRLIDMGVPPFLLANVLNTTVAQRLLRLLCPNCKKEVIFDESLYPRQFKPYRRVEKHWQAVGCPHCFHTGYKGRKAVYEVIPIDLQLAGHIKIYRFDITDILREQGIRTLAENAFELFETGQTSLEEAYPLLVAY